MPPEKVTVMILDVDLKCSGCYKKVKKVLCKFPEIRDQVFDEDKNKVRISVVCCSPEKIRDKLCCKGGKAIQRIEIVEDKPEEPKKPKPVPPKEPENPKEPQKPKETEKPKQPEKKPSGKSDPMCGCPQPVYPPACPVPVCCQDCYEGRRGGPCEYGYGMPVPPPPGPCYDGYRYQYSRNSPCYVSRCDYVSEENPQGCSIM